MRSFVVALALLLLILVPVAGSLAQGGIALVPGSIELEDALRNSTVTRTIAVLNSTDQDRGLEVEIDGAAAGWITVTMPDGTPISSEAFVAAGGGMDLRVEIAIPQDAPNGLASAEVVVSLNALTASEDEVSVDLALVAPVDVNVTGEQRLEGAFREFVAQDAELGMPVRMFVSLSNTGNVEVNPTMRVEIEALDGPQEGQVVGEALGGRQVLSPGESQSFGLTWPTENERPGRYLATASVGFAELELGTKTAEFVVAQRGTLTRAGQIRSMELVGEPVFGGVTRAEVEFVNTGQIEARATFLGELTRDGTLIEVVQSLERLTLAGEVTILEVFLQTAEAGDYELRGKVNFEGSETDELALAFAVTDPSVVVASGSPDLLVLGLGLGAGLLVAGGTLLVWRRRRRARSTPQLRGSHSGPSTNTDRSDHGQSAGSLTDKADH